jgi:hypothetical protein
VSLNDQGFNKYLKFLIMKNLMNLGKILNKNEQKLINGGKKEFCECDCHQDGSLPYCGLYGTLSQCCG